MEYRRKSGAIQFSLYVPPWAARLMSIKVAILWLINANRAMEWEVVGTGQNLFLPEVKCKSSLSFSIAFVLSGTLDFKQTIIFLSSLGVMTLRLLLSLYLSSGTSANTCHGNEDKKLCFHYPCLAEHSSKLFFQVQNWNRSSGFRQVGKHWMYLTKAQHIACSGRSGSTAERNSWQRGNSGVKKLGRPGSGY